MTSRDDLDDGRLDLTAGASITFDVQRDTLDGQSLEVPGRPGCPGAGGAARESREGERLAGLQQ
ncbi:MAG: hypothetical protein ABW219_17035 [Ilumatobacteraceae bacterium]